MKTCEIHFDEYDETKEECPYCERDRLMRFTPDVRAAEKDESTSGPPAPENVPENVPESAPETDAGKTPEAAPPAPQKARTPPGARVNPSTSPPSAAADIEALRAREEEPAATIPIEELLADIEEFKRLGVPIIVIIGLSQSGKTWFQMTLRDALRIRGIGSPEGWVRAGRVDATKSIGFCRFTGMGDTEAQRAAFVVVDVPGEQLNNLLARQWVATRALIASIQAASSIILTLPSDQVAFSDLVARNIGKTKLPVWLSRQLQAIGISGFTASDIEALAGRHLEIEARVGAALEQENSATALSEEDQVYLAYKRFRDLLDSRERLDELGANLVYLASLLSLMKVNKLGPEDIGTERVTDRLIRNHAIDKATFQPVGGRDGKDCPLFVALTKADLFLSLVSHPGSDYHILSESLRSHIGNRVLAHVLPDDERERLCALSEDPRRILGRCKPKILADINSWFRLNKIDFVTTHFGYDGGNTIEIDQHPDKQFGIEFVIQWIHWARSAKRKHGLKYLATEMARIIRTNFVDRQKRFETTGWS